MHHLIALVLGFGGKPPPPSPSGGALGGAIDMQGAQYSAINALRTGNVIFDMCVAMLVPLLFKLLFTDSKALLVKLYNLIFGPGSRESADCIRTIAFQSVGSSLTGREHKNHVLQKAITLYMTHIQVPFNKKSQVSLTAVHDTSVGMGPVDRYDPLARYRLTFGAPENEWVTVEPGLQFMQKTQREGRGGGDDDDDFGGSSQGITRETIVFEFKATARDGPERIDAFIDKSLRWYKAEVQKMRDDCRYMYTMVSNASAGWSVTATSATSKKSGGGGDDSTGFKYKRYKLSDQKTFASIFFRERETILKLLADFESKSGKYGIPGYPHKLGLLLHGPPGTGKTSLIKALAHHTGRSIINIPLARLSTNQQLMDLMYDLKLSVAGQDMAIQLSFKDVIFVMEDVDAASSIVHRREPEVKPADATPRMTKTTVEVSRPDPSVPGGVRVEKVTREISTDASSATPPEPGTPSKPAPAAGGGFAKTTSTASAATATLPPAHEAGHAAAADAGAAEAMSSQVVEKLMRQAEPDEGVVAAPGAVTAAGGNTGRYDPDAMLAKMSKFLNDGDELNLAGLLNVLDGVVDTPERILVMVRPRMSLSRAPLLTPPCTAPAKRPTCLTHLRRRNVRRAQTSNHPEKLDPALIRPGRIDKQLYLGFMRATEGVQMVEHYFGIELSAAQRERVLQLLPEEGGGLALTPAALEQACAEHDDVDAMLDSLLQRMSGPMLVPARAASTAVTRQPSRW